MISTITFVFINLVDHFPSPMAISDLHPDRMGYTIK